MLKFRKTSDMYMQQLYQREILIAEQQFCELNPFCSCICDTRPLLRNRSTVPDNGKGHTPTGKHWHNLMPNVSTLIRLNSVILTTR